MTPRVRWALRLYPRAWRERYGNEFEALLTETGLDSRSFFNVILGAIDMQVRSISFYKLAAVLGLAGLIAGAVSFLGHAQDLHFERRAQFG